MRRFSIAKLMLVVAVLALNLGVIRLALPEAGVGNARWLLLTGLLPIADALLFLCFRIASRHRICLRKRNPGGDLAIGTAAAFGLFLGFSTLDVFLHPGGNYFFVVETIGWPAEVSVEALWRSIKVECYWFNYVMAPVLLRLRLMTAVPRMLLAFTVALV